MLRIRDAVAKTQKAVLEHLSHQVDAEWPIIEADVLDGLKRGKLKIRIKEHWNGMSEGNKLNGVSPPDRHLQPLYCRMIADRLNTAANVYIDQRNEYGSRDYLIVHFPEPVKP